MKYFIALTLVTVFGGFFAHAQKIDIAVPMGWTVSESGISKGQSELLVGPIFDLGELGARQLLGRTREDA